MVLIALVIFSIVAFGASVLLTLVWVNTLAKIHAEYVRGEHYDSKMSRKLEILTGMVTTGWAFTFSATLLVIIHIIPK